MKISSRLQWMVCGAALTLIVGVVLRLLDGPDWATPGAASLAESVTESKAPADEAEKNPAGLRNWNQANAERSATFERRLAEALVIANKRARDRKVSSVLVEWLRADFPHALAWLAGRGYSELARLPQVAELVALQGTADDFAAIAETADHPYDALRSLALPNLDSRKRAALINLMRPLVDETNEQEVSSFTGLLTSQNLDAGLHYARGISGLAIQGPAYAAVIDQLRLEGSTTEAQEIYDALPEKLKSHDHVLFAQGLAMRDIDPDAAMGSLARIADPQFRMLALVKFSRDVETVSPGAAIQAILSSGLTNQGITNHAGRIISTWASHDSAAAREFLRTASGLSEPQRVELLGLIDGAGGP